MVNLSSSFLSIFSGFFTITLIWVFGSVSSSLFSLSILSLSRGTMNTPYSSSLLISSSAFFMACFSFTFFAKFFILFKYSTLFTNFLTCSFFSEVFDSSFNLLIILSCSSLVKLTNSDAAFSTFSSFSFMFLLFKLSSLNKLLDILLIIFCSSSSFLVSFFLLSISSWFCFSFSFTFCFILFVYDLTLSILFMIFFSLLIYTLCIGSSLFSA